MRASGAPHVLLDVRNDDEVRQAGLAGALHIPMYEIPARLSEVPKSSTIVVMCHVGERSRRVAEFLVDRGFTAVFNLEGGIDAYATNVDLSVPRY